MLNSVVPRARVSHSARAVPRAWVSLRLLDDDPRSSPCGSLSVARSFSSRPSQHDQKADAWRCRPVRPFSTVSGTMCNPTELNVMEPPMTLRRSTRPLRPPAPTTATVAAWSCSPRLSVSLPARLLIYGMAFGCKGNLLIHQYFNSITGCLMTYSLLERRPPRSMAEV